MSTAAFNVTKWRNYRNAPLYGTTMEKLIDADLKDKNPPSADTIVELILLGDTQFMTAMFATYQKPIKSPYRQLRAISIGAISHNPTHRQLQAMSISVISHNPTHPFYKRIKNAFAYANSRRKKACLSLDKWPIPQTPPPPPPRPPLDPPSPPPAVDRRLVWSLNQREVCAARGVFRRYVRDGMMPYKVGVDGQATAEIMKEFDPIAEEIIFMPGKAISGG